MIGKTISHYKISKKIGEGGMGEVYLADDLKLDRKVAIKFLPEHLTKNKENVERFEREAKAAAALNHPNIVTIHDIIGEDDQTCIVMEHLDGDSLRIKINKAASDLDDVLSITKQICEGLSEAHKADIVHRDIKPENILIDSRGRVKILDFGLAKLKGVSKLTKETSTLGTIHYMSPEQIQGQQVDQRSDIWSLGVVIYELLTGEVPFNGEYEQAVTYGIVNENIKPVIDKNTPEELIRIIEKCLTKNPADRYQNADEIINDLSFFKEESTLKPTRRIHSTNKRYIKITIPVLVAIAAVVILLFVAPEAESTAPIPIAVVDFVNETGEDELSSLSGMLTTALDQSKRLSVITRSHMFDILRQLEKENIDYIDENLGREIAKQAGIKVLVLASIQKFDQLYNIDLKIIDPIEDKYLFTASEKDRGKENIPEMIDRLSEKTREGLKESEEEIQLSSLPIAEITTPNLEAYQHYFKGQEYIEKVWFEEAISEFEKAIALDSTFGLAYYGLAYCFGWEEYLIQAKEPIKMAFQYIDQIPDKEKYLVRFVKTITDSGWGEAGLKILREMEIVYPNDKEMIYNIGALYYHIEDYQESIKYFTRVLEMDNRSARIFQHLYLAYRILNDYDQMLNISKKYVTNLGDFESYQFLAESCINLNDIDSGIKELEKRLDLIPEQKIHIIPSMIILYFKKGEKQNAKILLKDYLVKFSVNDYMLREIGWQLNILRQYPEAEELFQRAIKINPDDTENLSYFGWSMLNQHKYEQAEELFQRAIKINPDDARILNGLGRSLLYQWKNEEAEKLFVKLNKNEPTDPNILSSLGWSRLNQDKDKQAEQNFKDAFKSNPKHEGILDGLSNVNLKLKKYDQAEYYTKLMHPTPWVKERLSKIYHFMGKVDLAEDNSKNAIILDSTYVEAYRSLGYICAIQDRFNEAELYARKAVEQDSSYFSYNLLSWILIVSEKDIEEGFKTAVESIESRSNGLLKYIQNTQYAFPDYYIAEYNIGLGYYKKGDYKQAVSYLEKADHLVPEREEIENHLNMAKKKLASSQ